MVFTLFLPIQSVALEIGGKAKGQARGFAELVARAHYQGVRVVLLKNGKPWAWIVQIPPGAAQKARSSKKKRFKSR